MATHYIALGQYGQHLAYPSVVFIQRYLIGVYAMPILAVALYLPVFLGARRASRLELPQWVLLTVLGLATMGRVDFSEPFPAYWPPEVACLDEAAEEYDLKVGLALLLGFVGAKMLVSNFYGFPILMSLGVICGILVATALASYLKALSDSQGRTGMRQ